MFRILTASTLLLMAGCQEEAEPSAQDQTPVLTVTPETERRGAADAFDADTLSERLEMEDMRTQSDDLADDQAGSLESSNRLAAAAMFDQELAARGVEEITWYDLMPEGEEEILTALYQQQMMSLYSAASTIQEGSPEDIGVQIGTFNVVPEFNGRKVRLPGYVVPLSTSREITEFLLVPDPGACLHFPPPPPNQTIYASLKEPVKLRDIAYAVWVEGTIYTEIQESELADAAYTISVDLIEDFIWP